MENKKDYIEKISELLTDLINNSIQASKDAGLLDASIKHEYTIKNILNIVYDLKIINTNDIKSNYPGIDLVDEENKTVYQITSQQDKQKEKINKTIKEIENNNLINKHNISKIIIIFLISKKQSFHKNTKVEWINWIRKNNVKLKYYDLDDFKTCIIKRLQKEHDDKKTYRLLQYLQINNKKALCTFEINKYYKKIYKNLQNFTTSNFIGLKKNVDNFMLSDNQILLLKAVQGHGKSHFINYLAENSNFNWYIPALITNTSCPKDILDYFNTKVNWVIIIDDIDRYKKDFIQYLLDGILMYDNIKLIFTCRQAYEFNIENYNYNITYEILPIKWEEKHINELINKYKEIHPEKTLSYYEYEKIKYEANNNPYFILYLLDNNLLNINECKENNFKDIMALILKGSEIEKKQTIYNILINICLNIPFDINKININNNYKTVLNILVQNKFMYKNNNIYRFNYDIVGDLVLAKLIDEQIYKEDIFLDILQNNSYNIMFNMSYALEYVNKQNLCLLEDIFKNYIDEINEISLLNIYIPIIYKLPNFGYLLFTKFQLKDIELTVTKYYIDVFINRIHHNISTQIYSINDIIEIIINIYKLFNYRSLSSFFFNIKKDNTIIFSIFYSLINNLFNIYEFKLLPKDILIIYNNFIQKLINIDIPDKDINIIELDLIKKLYNERNNIDKENYKNYKKKYLAFFISLNRNYIKRNENNINEIENYITNIARPCNFLTNKVFVKTIYYILIKFKHSYREQMILEESIIIYMLNSQNINKLDNIINILSLFHRPVLYIFYCYLKNFTAPYIIETNLPKYKKYTNNEKIIFQNKLLKYGIYDPREDFIPYNSDNLNDYFDFIKSQNNIIDFIINLDDDRYQNLEKFIQRYDDLVFSLYQQYHNIKSNIVKQVVSKYYFKIKKIYISNKKISLCTEKNILYALIETINKNNINTINFRLLTYKIIKLDNTLSSELLKKINDNFSYIEKNNINAIINIIIIFMKIPFPKLDMLYAFNISRIISCLKKSNYNIIKIKKYIINNIIQLIRYSGDNADFIYSMLNNSLFDLKYKGIMINKLLDITQNREVDYTIFKALRHFINNQDEFNLLINSLINHYKINPYIKTYIHTIIDGIFYINLQYFEEDEEEYNLNSNDTYKFFDDYLININNNIELLLIYLELFARYCTAKNVALILDKIYKQVDENKIYEIISNTSNRYATINSDIYINMYLCKLVEHVTNDNIKNIINNIIDNKIKYTKNLDIRSIDRHHLPRTPYGA